MWLSSPLCHTIMPVHSEHLYVIVTCGERIPKATEVDGIEEVTTEVKMVPYVRQPSLLAALATLWYWFWLN